MNTGHHSYPSFELSPFCTNDQVYKSAATDVAYPCGLPGYNDLLDSIDNIGEAVAWPVTLLVIGLSPFKAGQLQVDDQLGKIGALGAAAKLQHCIRRCDGTFRKTSATSNAKDLTSSETRQPEPTTPDHYLQPVKLYRLTDSQFAALGIVPAASLAHLCDSVLSTLDQPLYVGDQPLTTSANIGIAREIQHQIRPESFIRAAQSALLASRQIQTE